MNKKIVCSYYGSRHKSIKFTILMQLKLTKLKMLKFVTNNNMKNNINKYTL